MPRRLLLAAVLCGAVLCASAVVATEVARLVQRGTLAAIAPISEIEVQDGHVSGTLSNRSSHSLRQVQIMISYQWLWTNEMHPGEESPADADIVTFPEEMAPGGTVRFTRVIPPQLLGRIDGSLQVSARVVSLEEIIPGAAAR